MAKLTEEKLQEWKSGLDAARSTVYVSAMGLDHGDTDLELQFGTALKHAYEQMDEIYSDMLMTEWPRESRSD
jgi:hypothetical protein